MIRCINRLEEHQKGKIIVDEIELTHDVKNIAEIRREVGMVFQHFNLFPHLTVLENCTLAPIWVRKTPKKERSEEHTSELQSLMRISYAVFCLKKKNERKNDKHKDQHTEKATTRT